jgi:hypothetical protein
MATPAITWKRTLRSASSERFLAFVSDREAAAVDLHYLPSGHVSGTVIILEGAGLGENDIPALLRALDEDMLPDVDLDAGTLTYTVVIGRLAGTYEAGPEVKAT